MDIWEYYGEVEALIRDLRDDSRDDVADPIERALRRGATSGEILGELSITLSTVGHAAPGFADRSDALARWARETIA